MECANDCDASMNSRQAADRTFPSFALTRQVI
jgi:hypothetical protein